MLNPASRGGDPGPDRPDLRVETSNVGPSLGWRCLGDKCISVLNPGSSPQAQPNLKTSASHVSCISGGRRCRVRAVVAQVTSRTHLSCRGPCNESGPNPISWRTFDGKDQPPGGGVLYERFAWRAYIWKREARGGGEERGTPAYRITEGITAVRRKNRENRDELRGQRGVRTCISAMTTEFEDKRPGEPTLSFESSQRL